MLLASCKCRFSLPNRGHVNPSYRPQIGCCVWTALDTARDCDLTCLHHTVQVYDGDVSRGYADVKYARCNNTPNHFALAKKLSELEGTEVGLAVAVSAGTWHGAGSKESTCKAAQLRTAGTAWLHTGEPGRACSGSTPGWQYSVGISALCCCSLWGRVLAGHWPGSCHPCIPAASSELCQSAPVLRPADLPEL